MKNYLQFTIFFVTILLFSCQEKNNNIELFPFKEGVNYGYFDASGKEMISAKYAYATVFRDGLAIVKLHGNTPKYTFIDEKGKIVFNKTYASISVFSEGLAWVSSNNSYPTAIDKNGNVQFSIKNAERVKIFKDGLAAYSVKDSISEKWGFVDSSGKTVIQPQFYHTGNFREGVCAVKDEDGNWKYIDKKGIVQFQQSFRTASDFWNEKAIISDNFEEKFGLINSEGNVVLEPELDSIVYDKKDFLVKKEGKWGWIDATGKTLIEPKFEDAFPFGESDLAVVKLNGLYGFIDKKGVTKIDFQFQKAHSFSGETAYVVQKNAGSLIDKKGNAVVKNKFSGISEDLITYLNDGNSSYEMIQTDYFDVAGVLKEINVNNPGNFKFDETISEIVPKLFSKKLPDNKELDLTVFFLRKIATDAYLSLYVIRNDENKIAGFWYKVELGGKNFYKPAELEKAFIKNLRGYTKIEAPDAFINQGAIKAYKNKNHILLISGSSLNNEFIVEILNPSANLDGYRSRYYGNHQNTDTDDLASLKEMELFREEE